jgi:hypothetical protein
MLGNYRKATKLVASRVMLSSIELIRVTSRQGNNEEQAHTRNKGTNEHDRKETAIFLETSINT